MVRFSEHLFYYQWEQYSWNYIWRTCFLTWPDNFWECLTLSIFTAQTVFCKQLVAGLWKIFALDTETLKILLSNLGVDYLGRWIHLNRELAKCKLPFLAVAMYCYHPILYGEEITFSLQFKWNKDLAYSCKGILVYIAQIIWRLGVFLLQYFL